MGMHIACGGGGCVCEVGSGAGAAGRASTADVARGTCLAGAPVSGMPGTVGQQYSSAMISAGTHLVGRDA